MVKTVLESFDEFMSNCVNLDKEVVAAARKSRDNLLENISEFVDEDFFKLCSDYNVHFGSFARKTKCRELDDIDLMIGISAEGALYNNFDNGMMYTLLRAKQVRRKLHVRAMMGH